MSKQKIIAGLSPQQVLQRDAQRLAEIHQQRLHQMTREAVYGVTKKQHSSVDAGTWFGINKWAMVVPVFSLTAIALVLQLIQQPEISPGNPLLALKDNAPGWVKETDIPLAVIEKIEFYQWLEKELRNDTSNLQQSSQQQNEQKNNYHT